MTEKPLAPTCQGCGSQEVEPTGRMRPHKKGNQQAEVRCLDCGNVWWSLKPQILRGKRRN